MFMDVHVHAGQRWNEFIKGELDNAHAVVVLWSRHSISSRWCMAEANFAADRDIIYPALIEDVEVPFGFEIFQTVDLTDWKGGEGHEGLSVLVEALTAGLSLPRKGLLEKTGAQLPPVDLKVSLNPAGLSRKCLKAGSVFQDDLRIGGTGPEMVVVPTGHFRMRSTEGKSDQDGSIVPQHEGAISQPFAMGKYAVTFDDYLLYARSVGVEKPDDQGWGTGKRPVINVSWLDANNYCEWLSEQTGEHYRLPREAEWEYVCRAGTQILYSAGDRISSDQAHYTYKLEKTREVGSYRPNGFGLYDMYDNVWEWVEDWWSENYKCVPSDGLAGAVDHSMRDRMMSSDSWVKCAVNMRSAYRDWYEPGYQLRFRGFRVVCSLPSTD